MFNNFLNALDDYIDLKAETERDAAEFGDSRRWHEHNAQKRNKIVARMQDAFNDAVENLIPGLERNVD